MQREVFVVEKERFDLADDRIYHLQGTWPKEHTAAAELDGKPLEKFSFRKSWNSIRSWWFMRYRVEKKMSGFRFR